MPTTFPLMSPAIDTQKLLECCMGHAAFAKTLLQEFANSADARLAEFKSHASRSDMHALCNSAHSLRGVAGIIGATTLHEMSMGLEHACHNSQGDLAAMLQSLYSEIQNVQQTIRRICPEP